MFITLLNEASVQEFSDGNVRIQNVPKMYFSPSFLINGKMRTERCVKNQTHGREAFVINL